VEKAPELIAQAPALPADTQLVQGDICHLPAQLEIPPFDVVVALAVLEHLKTPLAAISEAHRVLRPGGLFVASCPVPFWDQLATRVGFLAADQHEIHPDKKTLTRLLRDGGFELASYRRFMWAPSGVLAYLNWRLPVSLALKLDHIIARLPLLHHLHVNQLIVARRPR
jgi:SAM-dependent methyltransferase